MSDIFLENDNISKKFSIHGFFGSLITNLKWRNFFLKNDKISKKFTV